jgi:hypothetical protein
MNKGDALIYNYLGNHFINVSIKFGSQFTIFWDGF